MEAKNLIFNNNDIQNKIKRISLEVYEEVFNDKKLTIIGISKNGYEIAKKIKNFIEEYSNLEIKIYKIDILKKGKGYEIKIEEKYDINNSTVLLVDDVSQSGRTLQFVISNLINLNPSKIKTSVIVNRDQTLFPVKVDFSGVKLSTSVNEHIDFIIDEKKEFNVFLS
tara:strand:- start:563 stop:1063 length:501 start_codon:yes stop_codon:yes gene_type:complete